MIPHTHTHTRAQRTIRHKYGNNNEYVVPKSLEILLLLLAHVNGKVPLRTLRAQDLSYTPAVGPITR